VKIVWFSEEASPAEIGGKSFRLSRLIQAGFPVPPGFCVTVAGMDSISAEDIEDALARLGPKPVAVRSSAVEEDTPTASFAGIYLSRLNVGTAADVVKALLEIRESAASPAALAYRKRHRLSGPPRMAAIVQELLVPEASGVLFMKDPLDGSNRIVIEASWGLGEAVVAGRVTPDRWVLSSKGEVISSHISDKDVAVMPSASGTTEVEVEPARRKFPAVNDETLRKLFELSRGCEKLFETPQDIEWATASNHVWLLQSRPITRPCNPKQPSN
jgi:pyruvate,water dikinase